MIRLVPHPPLVSQLRVELPDGTIDPASATDCGWACVSAVMGGFRGEWMSPGCLRQMMGKSQTDGRSTPEDLHRCLQLLEFGVRPPENAPSYSHAGVRRALRHNKYAILLGYFQGFAELHWVLAYHPGDDKLWVMDPWVGEYRGLSWPSVAFESAGPMLLVGPHA